MAANKKKKVMKKNYKKTKTPCAKCRERANTLLLSSNQNADVKKSKKAAKKKESG